MERAGSPNQCLCTAPALTLRFVRATPIFSLFMNAEKQLHLGSLFLTFKLKQWLPIFHNGMTSRNGNADSTGIDPAGRQETQTDAEHVIRGATLTQQAGSICLENAIPCHNEHLKILAEEVQRPWDYFRV